MNWSPLDGGDPMPGDPEGVFQLVGILRSYVNECNSLQSQLSKFDTSSWIGSAADEFRNRYGYFSPKLINVGSRLNDTSTILNEFAAQIEAIQSQALNASKNAGTILTEIESISHLANEQRMFVEKQELGTLIGKPAQPWTGPNYIEHENELQAQYRSQQLAFSNCVSSYGAIASRTAARLSQVSKDSLSNNWLSVIEHYADDVSSAEAWIVQTEYQGLVATIDFIKGHMTQILDVIGMIVAVAAIAGSGGLALGVVAALVGVAQAANSVVLHHEKKLSTDQMWLGIGEGALSMVSGSLIGAAAREVNGAADAGSTLGNGFMDILSPVEASVPDAATFATSFAFRLTNVYTPILSVVNFYSAEQSLGTDFISPNFSILEPNATP